MVPLCISPVVKIWLAILLGSALALLDMGIDIYWIIQLFRNDLNTWGVASLTLLFLFYPAIGFVSLGIGGMQSGWKARCGHILQVFGLALVASPIAIILDLRDLILGIRYLGAFRDFLHARRNGAEGPHIFFRRAFVELFAETVPQLVLKVLAFSLTSGLVDGGALAVALFGSTASLAWNAFKIAQFKAYFSLSLRDVARLMFEGKRGIGSLVIDMFVLKRLCYETHVSMSYDDVLDQAFADYVITQSAHPKLSLDMCRGGASVVKEVLALFRFVARSRVKGIETVTVNFVSDGELPKELVEAVLGLAESSEVGQLSLANFSWGAMKQHEMLEILHASGVPPSKYSLTQEGSGCWELTVNFR